MRLKIWLMARDAPPLAVPWNLPYSLEAYVGRRDAVSADCRLSAAEELGLATVRRACCANAFFAGHACGKSDEWGTSRCLMSHLDMY